MRKVSLEKEMYYHVYNRGVDRREIFLSDEDRRRFLRACVLLNDDEVMSQRYPLQKDGHHPFSAQKPLVSIISYVLMDNHIHFVLKQLREDGIARFMQRIGTSYTKYFNLRHGRTGSLFESTYKAVFVESSDHFLHLTRYVHLNPLDLFTMGADRWEQLLQYPWSSLQKYLLGTHDPVVDVSDLLSMISPLEYGVFLKEWLPEWRSTTEA